MSRLLAAAALAALALGTVAPAAAQQPERAERGWLGVRIGDQLKCEWEGRAERAPCERVLVIQEVMVGGPADRAGVRPGDLLLAINGTDLDDPGERMELFAQIRPGTPISIDLGRAGERHFVQLVPARRPTDMPAIAWRGAEVVSEPDVYVLPAEPLARLRDGSFAVTIRTGDDGVVVIRPGRITLQGDSIHLDFDSLAAHVGLESLTAEAARAISEVAPRVGAEFGEQLRLLQDSVFRYARVKLDSLRQLMMTSEAYERMATEMYERALERSRRQVREPGRVSVGIGRHVAGAEFEPLSPELAEAFEGVDRGLLVLRVLADTPAAKLGLRPGDVVTHAGDQECESVTVLRTSLIRGARTGPVTVRWVRRGQPMSGVLKGP